MPNASTCAPWATIEDLAPTDEIDGLDSKLLNDSLQIASDILFELTGRRWSGLCHDTVRPVLRGLSQDLGRPVRPPSPFGGPYGDWPATSAAGPTWGFWLGNRTDRAGGQIIPEITLGAYPLVADTTDIWAGESPDGWSILIDGVELPMFDANDGHQNWRIDDDRWLVRMADPVTRSNPGWPTLNAMDLDSSQPGTWQVTFPYGAAPPTGGVRGAAQFGYQLALAYSPTTQSRCQLPRRVTNLNRQGVQAVVLDPMTFLKEGRVGLYEVDSWINSVNRGVPFAQRAHVSSPDIQRRVRRAGI